MPVTKNRFSCGHHGLGAKCHRCEQAAILEKKDPIVNKDEIARLRGMRQKKSIDFTLPT